MVTVYKYHNQLLSPTASRLSSPLLRGPAERAWVLTGSIGALKAIRRFLRCISGDLPVAFVVTIRIPRDGLPLMVNLLARDNGYRVYGPEPGRTLCRRDVVVVPADEPVLLGPDGRFESAPAGRGESAPSSIDETLRTVARRYRARAGVIIFSGIGMEGVQGCHAISEYGGQIWVQDSESCQFNSMPDYIQNVCDVTCRAAPEALAAKLVESVVGHRDRYASDPGPRDAAFAPGS